MRLKGPSWDHLVQPPAPAGVGRAGSQKRGLHALFFFFGLYVLFHPPLKIFQGRLRTEQRAQRRVLRRFPPREMQRMRNEKHRLSQTRLFTARNRRRGHELSRNVEI